MGTITLTSVTLGNIIVENIFVNVKYRLTADPDIAGSYTNFGDFQLRPGGNFVSPVVISGLPDGTQYTVWITAPCSNSSITHNYTTPSPTVYYNDRQHEVFTRNDCVSPQSGTAVDYVVPASAYSSVISLADANNQALADIAANGQDYANSHGSCIDDTLISTLLIDYLVDVYADLCLYCDTIGVAETGSIVASTANGGPLQYPNDGRDPANCYLLSSDKLSGPPTRRFGVNMAYFITQYPAIDHFTFMIRGRSDSIKAVSGSYALRDVTQGHLVMGDYGGGLMIPGVSAVSTPGVTSYSTNVTAGADATVGISVGVPVLQLDYVVSTNTLTKTTF
jgi:hypothetical protein